MHTLMSTVTCPNCGQPASIRIYEAVNPDTGTNAHQLEFSCPGDCRLPEAQLIRLWALARS
jgi:hypothetical protein